MKTYNKLNTIQLEIDKQARLAINDTSLTPQERSAIVDKWGESVYYGHIWQNPEMVNICEDYFSDEYQMHHMWDDVIYQVYEYTIDNEDPGYIPAKYLSCDTEKEWDELFDSADGHAKISEAFMKMHVEEGVRYYHNI